MASPVRGARHFDAAAVGQVHVDQHQVDILDRVDRHQRVGESSLVGLFAVAPEHVRPIGVLALMLPLGDLLQERYKLKQVIMEQPVRELPLRDGKLLDTKKERLDSLVERCDVVITASGD